MNEARANMEAAETPAFSQPDPSRTLLEANRGGPCDPDCHL